MLFSELLANLTTFTERASLKFILKKKMNIVIYSIPKLSLIMPTVF